METLKMQRNALNKQIGEKKKVTTTCHSLYRPHALCLAVQHNKLCFANANDLMLPCLCSTLYSLNPATFSTIY